MSITTGDFRQKVTVHTLADKKHKHEPIVCLTAYDYATARLADEAGVELILVGDSLAQVVLGYDSTLPVTVEEMLHHSRAVRRAVRQALLVVDMPFGSYHTGLNAALEYATRFVKEGGAEAVKIEGGVSRVELIRAMLDAEIPVVGHIGLTPQSVHRMGGYKVQGKTVEAMDSLLRDAAALDAAGVSALVLEGIPREVAARITSEVATPTIGIGAGPECDGQILVFHDLAGLTFHPAAKFVRRYCNAGEQISTAITSYRDDVRRREFPSDAESYHLPREVQAGVLNELSKRKIGG
ncbi:MAG: 3-methyl-2-oxobutanoate hydroxymethyltransferase [Acidobacteriota bacterium]|nr:3-methyl-2-oxobutanoate hydroxymethyltransferase [Acidobacteriota bacterium]